MIRSIGAYLMCVMLCFRLVWQVGYIGYYETNTEKVTNLYCIKKNEKDSKCKARCFLIKQLDKFEIDQATNGNTHTSKLIKIDLPEFLTLKCPDVPGVQYTNINACKRSCLPRYTPSDHRLIETPPPRA